MSHAKEVDASQNLNSVFLSGFQGPCETTSHFLLLARERAAPADGTAAARTSHRNPAGFVLLHGRFTSPV